MYTDGTLRALPNVKRRWVYYLLQFTWGLPLNIVGGLAAVMMLICGRPPRTYGWNICFELDVNFGLNLGVFHIISTRATTHTKNHEHGHGIQNVWFGPFTVGVVCLPSAIRFWVRRLKKKMNLPVRTEYDDAWFEGQATKTGDEFIEQIIEKE